MEIKDLKSLIKMVTETDITEFKMENKEEKILIKRGQEKEIIQVAAPVAAAPAAVAAPVSAAPAPAAPAAAAPAPVDDKYDAIPSPIVGTFYRKPSPDAAAFCEVGDIVEAGQVLCLVEAMKLFNEIEAEFKCKIVEIVKDDAAPVEYGETLFRVERL
ncbi:biotin carboxyl carrier protein [Malonomonas rubra DSM 5091]|uniref:Biotin carboxyl carrier protein of acetyl-CoA carboxylase n=1 Tax=Malonomonas rubra DSM 5091 TaxID=1122189 RepID=A0A1M6LIZ2_MALRU|nr:acetyl-CoA carboxylase biotin carboxyl carrier protein [Malonomonas rubra]SHJ71149.1 biotin carboxyl carrier protein [Malonomonas rubra DSM 5091]